MKRVSVDEAKRHLLDLVLSVGPGEEIEICLGDCVVARLTRAPGGKPRAGSAKGSILYMAPDFDAPLDDFQEYMG